MNRKILIVGGGIAGLTLLACLKKRGVEATLVERAPKFGTIGYVIGLFPNGLSVLRYLGLDTAIIERGEVLEKYSLKDINGNMFWEYDMADLGSDLPALELERSVLQETLVAANRGNDIRLGAVISEIREDKDGVYVTWADGTQDSYDLLIGADGIDSQVRKLVDPKRKQIYTGFTYWMEWMPSDAAISHKITNYVGNGKLIGMFPSKSSKGMMIFFGATAKEHSFTGPEAALAELFKEFRTSNQTMAEILEKSPKESVQVYHHDDDEIHGKVWHTDRIVLVGDAVHALSPLLGMGASMAMEDAYVLAEELSSRKAIIDAFESYEKRRKPRLRELIRCSLIMHKLVESTGLLAKLRPHLFRLVGGPRYMRVIRKLIRNKL